MRLDMTPLTIGLICFLSGGLVTGIAAYKITDKDAPTENASDIIKSLETELEKSKAKAVVNLTEPDLLKVPCSAEFINGTFDKQGKQLSPANGDTLCREMFCRMNRQGEEGATAQDCSSISDANISMLVASTCMPYWEEGAGADQNSRYQRCIDIFDDKK